MTIPSEHAGLVEELTNLVPFSPLASSSRYEIACAKAASALRRLQGEREELARKVFVPGLRRCAKCGLRLVSSVLNAHDGSVSAKNGPEDCPNGCGPMWPVTEREAGNELADRLDVATDRAQAAEARVEKLREALEELLSACEADFGVPDDGDEDDEAVDGGEGGDMAVTFGMLRRARAALSTTEEKP